MEIHRSKIKDALGILFCVSVLCLTFYIVTVETIPVAEQKFLWVLVMLVSLATACLLIDFLKKGPIYVFNEEGLYTNASKNLYSWKDIGKFTIKFKTERFLVLKVLSLTDSNNKELITMVLTGTDCCEEKLEKYLKTMLYR